MAFGWNLFQRKPQADEATVNKVPRNPNYSTFAGVSNDIERIVSQRSVIANQVSQNTPAPNPVWQTLGIDSSMLLMPIATNKPERLNQYRSMARFTESQWCIQEIANEFIHEDTDGNFITLKLPDNKDNLNEIRRKILQEQFVQYMELFKFNENGENLVKRFLVEGELAWENVINPNHPELGIKGVKFLPADYYETLVDTAANVPVGIIFDTEKMAKDIHEILSTTYMGAAQVFNRITPTMATFTLNKDTCIPMLYSQLTYINSGNVSYDGLISYPKIENCRQAYHQLALLQEAAVILRVTRAPEKLLYNVSTAGMNGNYADEYVRNFAQSLKAQKVAKPNGDIASVYNPISMLENYVFGKSTGNDGTTIESVGSSANYEQMADIEYFLRRFFKQFDVPFSRYKTPENAVPPQDQLTYEEHSFLRMVVNMQKRFALGFKNGFITHLKLRGIWDKYELKDSDLKIAFIKPSMYDLLETQQVMNAKMEIYKMALGDNDEFSKSLAQKKYLGWTDEDIKENELGLIRDKEIAAHVEMIGDSVKEHGGLVGYEAPLKFTKDEKTAINANAGNQNSEDSEDKDTEDNEGNENSEESAESPDETSNDESSESNDSEEKPTFGLT